MKSLAFIQNFSGPELILMALVILLFFGAKRLPGLFGSLGTSIGEFKRGMREEVETEVADTEQKLADSTEAKVS